ncbi:MAG: M1 family aminopeptidase [Bacteroidota bacterium]
MIRFLILFLCASITILAKDPYPKNDAIDVKHYRFELELNDTTDVIAGRTILTVAFRKITNSFELDLIGSNGQKGMTVRSVSQGNQPVAFTHANHRIQIKLNSAPAVGSELEFVIEYAGIPADGLIIGKNKFNERTFFGDNWPDRGRYWLPSIDHPYDKATVDFVITAPEQYQVVATGKQIEESNLPGKRKRTHWHESVNVPVKVMTIGVARFAIQLSGEPSGIPITTWVYPQNRDDGFTDFAIAPQVFSWLEGYIGPYAYEKLAHVQSKTRFGGLENASNIFYFENSVTGKKEREGLIAHETAHQWFGNSASESDWHHVWLSEGFATYFTALYFEGTAGRERFVEEMTKNKQQVIQFYQRNQAPIVDTTITDINKVLSTNTYQKAGWVLHMLRREIGDETFKKTVREYYATYKNGNALTSDFQRIAEKNSGRDLSTFFHQRLFRGGHPRLEGTWKFNAKTKEVEILIRQTQKEPPFLATLEIGVKTGTGQSLKPVQLTERSQKIRIPSEVAPTELILDPNSWLLFEGKISRK